MPRTLLLVIDPQNDFVSPSGALSVPGASADMDRLAAMLDRAGDRIDEIAVSLDQHHLLDISHPGFWRIEGGSSPDPFSRITPADLAAGRFRTADPAHAERAAHYLAALDAQGRYPHIVWPEHCLIGDPGADVWPALQAALHRWERRQKRNVLWVTKGTNPLTEHFSAVRAEVPDPADPGGTHAEDLLAAVKRADRVLVAGEARSHCVANTVRDLFAALPDPALGRKIVLLSDATSDVRGFESYGRDFVQEASARGMTTASTAAV